MRLNLKQSGGLIGGALLLTTMGFVVPMVAGATGAPNAEPSTAPSASVEPSAAPSNGATDGSNDGGGSTAACGDNVDFLAITSKNKETKYANGNPVELNTDDSESEQRAAILRGLRTYAYKDPAGASQLVTAFRPDTNWSALNTRLRTYVDQQEAWCNDVDAMLATASRASFSTESVDAGMWSLYQVPTGDDDVPVEIRQGTTSNDGTVAIFRVDGRKVMLRLDCHFQPVRDSKFPGVKKVHTAPKPSSSPSPSSGPSSHPSSSPKPSKSLAPKKSNQDPNHKGHAKQGGGTNTGNDTYVPPSQAPTVPSTPRPNPAPPTAAASSAVSSGSASSSGSSSSSGTSAGSGSSGSGSLNDGCVPVPGFSSC